MSDEQKSWGAAGVSVTFHRGETWKERAEALSEKLSLAEARIRELEADAREMEKDCVPISTDGNFVFIDGPGDVELDHGGKMRARIRELEAALSALVSVLDQCPRSERGVGGMTINAQLQRTFINKVPAAAVEDARDALRAHTHHGED